MPALREVSVGEEVRLFPTFNPDQSWDTYSLSFYGDCDCGCQCIAFARFMMNVMNAGEQVPEGACVDALCPNCGSPLPLYFGGFTAQIS